jgi:hypothetical protein
MFAVALKQGCVAVTATAAPFVKARSPATNAAWLHADIAITAQRDYNSRTANDVARYQMSSLKHLAA